MRSVRIVWWLVIWLVFVLMLPVFAESNTSFYVQIKKDIAAAVKKTSVKELKKTKKQLQKTLAGKKDQHAFLTHYYIAFVNDRILFVAKLLDDKKRDEQLLDEGITHLEKGIALKQDFTEGYILLSSFYGQKAANEMLASVFGPKSSYMNNKAKQLEPRNPRVYLIDGIAKYYSPVAFGGGADKALAAFRKAKKLFRGYKVKSPAYPAWGHPDVYAWLGQLYVTLDEPLKARQAYKEGLAKYPENVWLKTLAARLDKRVNKEK